MIGTKFYKPIQDTFLNIEKVVTDTFTETVQVPDETSETGFRDEEVTRTEERIEYERVKNDAPNTREKYAQMAGWCNRNNARIVDKGDYFEVEAIPVPVVTAQDIINQYDTAIEQWLDSTVQQRNYKNVESCISYEGDNNPKYAREAEAVKAWRSAVYTEAENLLAIYLGTNAYLDNASMPTIEQVIAELPQLDWNDPVESEEVSDGATDE